MAPSATTAQAPTRRGVSVSPRNSRPMKAAKTTLVSRGDGTNRGVGPTKGSGGESAMRIALLCA